MGNRLKNSIVVKFFAIFFVFTVLLTGISIAILYNRQHKLFEESEKARMIMIGNSINELMQDEGTIYKKFQEYVIANKDKIKIPIDFNGKEWTVMEREFYYAFQQEFPGEVFNKTVLFEQMSEDLKLQFCTYMMQKWIDIYEDYRVQFNIPYTYYLVPTGEEEHMYFLIDCIRDKSDVFGDDYMLISIDVEQTYEEHPVLWKTWKSGYVLNEYDAIDNEFGKVYAYFIPLYINGEKIGLVAVEQEIADFQKDMLHNSVVQVVPIFILLLLFNFILMFIIYRFFVVRLINLQNDVEKYSKDKDSVIAKQIRRNSYGKDEISSLGYEVSAMIMELEEYMQNLIKTHEELITTKQKAELLEEIATVDKLTGAYNRNAYEEEARNIQVSINEGYAKYCIVVVDLNYLKRVNDTYGHEHGDSLIQRLFNLVRIAFRGIPVYRIGGDEFVVILYGDLTDNVDTYIESFKSTIRQDSNNNLESWEKVSAAIGYAKYIETDLLVQDTFKRADKAMYENKKQMKANRED